LLTAINSNKFTYIGICIKERFVPTDEAIKYRLPDKGAEGRVILKLISRKWDGGAEWIDWLRKGTVGGCL
jgi:hypothetical protein